LLPPAAPASTAITQTLVKDSCGARYYRYSVPALLPAATANNVAANGFLWTMPFGSLGSTGALDSGSLSGRVIVIRYTSNGAAGSGDSIRVQYTSTCGNSPARSARLINNLLSAPLAPASITITPVNTNACNARIYRYAAPALSSYSVNRTGNIAITYAAATGYEWSFTGILGGNAVIDSGDASSRTILVRYTSNAAASAGDSVRVRFISDCGLSSNNSVKITNTALEAPVPASIQMQLVSEGCEGSVYRYLAPALPQANSTTMAATGYSWQMPVGPLGSVGILDSGSLSGGSIRIRYPLNESARTQDIIAVSYLTDCGIGPVKSERISNRKVNGCPTLAKIESNPSLGSGSLDAHIFPNPSYDQFKLQLNSHYSRLAEARIYDLHGRLISKLQVMPGQVIDFGSSLKPGAYIVEVAQGKKRKAYKILKY
jgi:hypothetical protein